MCVMYFVACLRYTHIHWLTKVDLCTCGCVPVVVCVWLGDIPGWDLCVLCSVSPRVCFSIDSKVVRGLFLFFSSFLLESCQLFLG